MAKYQIDNIPSPIDFQSGDLVQRTLQNVKNLLMCRMWEVPYDRFRGFDPAIYDLPIPALRTELLPELNRLMMYEPDVSVEDAEATLLPSGEVYIKVIVNCKLNENG